MKHAGAATLATLAPVLERLRALDGLAERAPGTFYFRSRAFLHFHEDPQGLFADIRLEGTEFTRLAVNNRAEQDKLLGLAARALGRATRQQRS